MAKKECAKNAHCKFRAMSQTSPAHFEGNVLTTIDFSGLNKYTHNHSVGFDKVVITPYFIDTDYSDHYILEK